MKKRWTFLFSSALLAITLATQLEAVVVRLDSDGVTFTNRQPIQAVVVDANGNNFPQTVYYDPALGGVDLDASWAGANASIYFPSLSTGYIWYNGYWVNPEGYYWNGANRAYVGPSWNNYWSGYWHNHNHWNGDWHQGNWHGNEWHGDSWRGDGDRWNGEGARRQGDWRDGREFRGDNRRDGGDRRGDNRDRGEGFRGRGRR